MGNYWNSKNLTLTEENNHDQSNNFLPSLPMLLPKLGQLNLVNEYFIQHQGQEPLHVSYLIDNKCILQYRWKLVFWDLKKNQQISIFYLQERYKKILPLIIPIKEHKFCIQYPGVKIIDRYNNVQTMEFDDQQDDLIYLHQSQIILRKHGDYIYYGSCEKVKISNYFGTINQLDEIIISIYYSHFQTYNFQTKTKRIINLHPKQNQRQQPIGFYQINNNQFVCLYKLYDRISTYQLRLLNINQKINYQLLKIQQCKDVGFLTINIKLKVIVFFKILSLYNAYDFHVIFYDYNKRQIIKNIVIWRVYNYNQYKNYKFQLQKLLSPDLQHFIFLSKLQNTTKLSNYSTNQDYKTLYLHLIKKSYLEKRFGTELARYVIKALA